MAYSKEIYQKAAEILESRRKNAEITAEQRMTRLCEEHPEFALIEAQLMETGTLIAKAFAGGRKQGAERLREIREQNARLLAKRAELLKSLSLPEDYTEVKYSCNKCRDTGFIEERDDEKGVSYGTHLCTCHKEILRRLAFDGLTKTTPLELSSFEDFDLSYYSKEGSPSPYSVMSTVFAQCKGYAQNFDTDSVSLFFYGRTGLGKTHLSLAIASEAIKKGYGVLYGSVIGFLNKLEKEKFGRSADEDTENLLIDADLLILDDLGAEFSTAYTTSALYNIINSRICRGLPTIISSNLTLKELRDRYPESIASRIIGNYALVSFAGEDIRQIMSNR